MTKQAYTYTVLRYVHDIGSCEFLNVGVVLYAPASRYVGALCRLTSGRISRTFAGMHEDSFLESMRLIAGHFEEIGRRFAEDVTMPLPESVISMAHAVLPADDSALQWSSPGAGITNDPEATLRHLFERFVLRYDTDPEVIPAISRGS